MFRVYRKRYQSGWLKCMMRDTNHWEWQFMIEIVFGSIYNTAEDTWVDICIKFLELEG